MEDLKKFAKYTGSGLLSVVMFFIIVGVLNYDGQLGSYSPWAVLLVLPAMGKAQAWFWK